MPYLPITDGQGNLLPSRTVIDVTSCAQLWPNNFDVGWALVERAYAGGPGRCGPIEETGTVRSFGPAPGWGTVGLGPPVEQAPPEQFCLTYCG